MTKTKKILLFGVPILVGGYFIYRQIRGTKVYNKAKAQEDCCKMTPIPSGCTGCEGYTGPENPENVLLIGMKQYKVTTLSTPLNVRQSPSVSSAKIGSIPKGTIIYARASETSGWMEYSENGTDIIGYVSADYLTEI
jgi:hypothetical protein